MRLVAAILFSTFVLAATGLYVRFADSVTPEPIRFEEVEATDSYSIDITLTFDLKVDIFAGFDPATLKVKLAGNTLYASEDLTLKAGTPVFLENVEGIKVGKNELEVFASPGPADVDSDPVNVSRALRVRIFQGNDPDPIVEETIWSERGPVQGRINLFVPGDTEVETHVH